MTLEWRHVYSTTEARDFTQVAVELFGQGKSEPLPTRKQRRQAVRRLRKAVSR